MGINLVKKPLIDCPDGPTTTVRGGQWRFNIQFLSLD